LKGLSMDLTILPQLLLSGLIMGAPLAVLGLGMSLILNVTHRFHFAFALTYTFAGMLAALLASRAGVPPLLAGLIAVVAAAIVGVAIEVLVYRPLARRAGDDALLPIFVSGLGLTIAGQSLIQLAWARDATTIPFSLMDNVPVPLLLGLRTTTLDIATLIVFSIIAALGIVVLRYTRAGQIVRGVRGNPTMARAVGIKPNSVYTWIFAFASGAAALAACFAASRYSATPTMGFDPLFSSFVVAFLAGSTAPALRVVLIGFALGLVQSASTLWIPSNLTNIVVFGLLFIYLILKGTGALQVLTFNLRRA
jgi:branched-chain amino acid transport system permease protein